MNNDLGLIALLLQHRYEQILKEFHKKHDLATKEQIYKFNDFLYPRPSDETLEQMLKQYQSENEDKAPISITGETEQTDKFLDILFDLSKEEK